MQRFFMKAIFSFFRHFSQSFGGEIFPFYQKIVLSLLLSLSGMKASSTKGLIPIRKIEL